MRYIDIVGIANAYILDLSLWLPSENIHKEKIQKCLQPLVYSIGMRECPSNENMK